MAADPPARAAANASPRVLVVALIGLPGAGKSAVAAHLAAKLQVRIVSRDAIRAAMFPSCRYSFVEKRAAFRALLTAIDVNCALGESSVVDGMTFAKRRDLERVGQRAEHGGAAFVPIWLDVPPHVARERVARDVMAGTHAAADRSPALVDAVSRSFDQPPASVSVVDASASLAAVLAAALEIVSARLVPS